MHPRLTRDPFDRFAIEPSGADRKAVGRVAPLRPNGVARAGPGSGRVRSGNQSDVRPERKGALCGLGAPPSSLRAESAKRLSIAAIGEAS